MAKRKFFNFKTSHVIVYLLMIPDYVPDTRISKHLMLLFICNGVEIFDAFRDISKHLMLLFISFGFLCNLGDNYFKTSHVIVYRKVGGESQYDQSISKHLMLLFIKVPSFPHAFHMNFKTSHVIVYQRRISRNVRPQIISKHLMLLFIGYELRVRLPLPEFQNISCYCLSQAANLIKLKITYFKTSHVIVYRIK